MRKSPQSAERMEELEESVWCVVRQKNEDQWKIYRTVVRSTLVYRAETWALKKARSYAARQDKK